MNTVIKVIPTTPFCYFEDHKLCNSYLFEHRCHCSCHEAVDDTLDFKNTRIDTILNKRDLKDAYDLLYYFWYGEILEYSPQAGRLFLFYYEELLKQKLIEPHEDFETLSKILPKVTNFAYISQRTIKELYENVKE